MGPFFIYLGIAAQNFGLILTGMIAPLLLFDWNDVEQRKHFRNLGFLLLGAWGLWPLCNALAALIMQRETLFHPPFNLPGPLSIIDHAEIKGNWFSSQLPSSVGVSGLILIVASFYQSIRKNRAPLANPIPSESESKAESRLMDHGAQAFKVEMDTSKNSIASSGESPNRSQAVAVKPNMAAKNSPVGSIELDASSPTGIAQKWIKLLFFSCLIFGVYFAIQHVTGFDFRTSQSYLPNMQFPGGTYRIQGFSGHPLTIAGISLCLVGFSSWMIGYFLRRSGEMLGYTTGILLLNLFFLYASGGRTAFFIAIVWLGLIGTLVASRLMKTRTLIISWFAVLLVLFFVLTMSGIGERYLEAFQMKESGKMPNRLVFWQVHWQMFLDSPWVGQGYGHLSKGLRFMYYDAMGYREFEERFNAHNMILETLSNIGILGTAALVAIGYKVFLIGKKIAQSNPLTKNIGIGLIVATGLNFLHGFTQNVFYDSGVMVVYMYLFWLFIWSALSLKRKNT